MSKSLPKLNQRKILAVIPARGGSKGIPGKNIKSLGGLPLIAWTIREAKRSKHIDRLIVSTEDKKIATVAKRYGAEVPFLRPKVLSRDSVSGVMPVLHAMKKLREYTEVVCLQPTSPFRTASDIDNFIRFARRNKAVSAASVCQVGKHPAWSFYLGKNRRLSPVLKRSKQATIRQHLRPAWALNGALYYAKTLWLLKNRRLVSRQTLGFAMPNERSLDLDTRHDWMLACCLVKSRLKLSG